MDSAAVASAAAAGRERMALAMQRNQANAGPDGDRETLRTRFAPSASSERNRAAAKLEIRGELSPLALGCGRRRR